ncbi:PAS domain-containing protein [Wukongibacter baidiensis]|uniref:PAS domain-containing protein n=1 Tax=Wukongibacter baidiensis TaxID=1723361 RepID=UPI003D7FF2DB
MRTRESRINEEEHLIELLDMRPSLLKVMLETVKTGIIISNRGTIEWANTTINKITGYKYEELIGRDFKKFFLNEYDGRIQSNIFKDLLHDNAWEDGKWSRRKNGEVYLASTKFLPMTDEESNSLSGLILIDDITSEQCY